MSKQSLVIDLPEDIYSKYKQRAEQMQRSVEAEIVEVVMRDATAKEKLSAELEELVSQLAYLEDKALRRIAGSKLAKKDARKIEVLHFKRQNENLNEAETSRLASTTRLAES